MNCSYLDKPRLKRKPRKELFESSRKSGRGSVILGCGRAFQTVLLARLFPSPGKTMTLPSLSFTTLIRIFRGGLLIPRCQSILFVSSLSDTSVVFILLATNSRRDRTALGVLFSLGAFHIRRRLRS